MDPATGPLSDADLLDRADEHNNPRERMGLERPSREIVAH